MSPFRDHELVRHACEIAGLSSQRLQLLRSGENSTWRVGPAVIARLARDGQHQAAEREVAVAGWLAQHEFPAVRTLPLEFQPVIVEGRAVTFWRSLGRHRPGSPTELAALLRRLHDLPTPTSFSPGRLEPMVRLRERIGASSLITDADRSWLTELSVELARRWLSRPDGLGERVVHGDAWVGNVAVDDHGQAVLLDLERTAVGPPEWDLVSTAIRLGSFAWITAEEYTDFASVYGHDVITWEGFELLRDIRELRMTSYLLQRAEDDPSLTDEAMHRVDCIRGRCGPRPWSWTASG